MKKLLFPLVLAACCLCLSANRAAAMDITDVVALLRSGIGEQVILEQIEAQDARFDLSTNDILDLKSAGASDTLIQEMIQRGPESDTPDNRGSEAAAGTAPTASFAVYYDPFAYYWYASPLCFSYYYPFTWWDSGFYYAGWWDRHWVGYGPPARRWHSYSRAVWHRRGGSSRSPWARDSVRRLSPRPAASPPRASTRPRLDSRTSRSGHPSTPSGRSAYQRPTPRRAERPARGVERPRSSPTPRSRSASPAPRSGQSRQRAPGSRRGVWSR